MSYGDQREAIRMGKADLEDVLGRACLGYRACYLSGNDDTFPICEELGLQWTSTSGAGSEKPDVYACWKGGWPFPYHPSRENRLVPGDMKIYDMPITRGIHTFFQGDPERPIDLRAETPPEIAGDNCEVFRQVIRENIEEMARRDQPVRGIFPASHNTSLFADESTFQHGHLVETCRMARELVEAAGHAFVPASYLEVKTKADEKPGPER